MNEWDAVAAAEERLQRKLYKFQLQLFVMEGDGNCQFRAVAFGLYGEGGRAGVRARNEWR